MFAFLIDLASLSFAILSIALCLLFLPFNKSIFYNYFLYIIYIHCTFGVLDWLIFLSTKELCIGLGTIHYGELWVKFYISLELTTHT